MATRAKAGTERLDDAHMERVIRELEQEKPITKKDACAILNIAYNTTRLGNLIDKYKEDKARDQARRAQLRGKPATRDEAAFIIQEYLEDATVDAISKSTYRSPQFIKQVLETNNVPLRSTSHDYFKPELIPDGAMQEKFEIGEVVYNARYDSVAKIVSEQKTEKYGWIYRVWLMSDKWLQYANSEAYELASLKHLRELGVRI
jgi:hypothetical protein